MKIADKQLPLGLREIAAEQKNKFNKKLTKYDKERITTIDGLPTEESRNIHDVHEVICVFIDMKSSTKLTVYWDSIYTKHEVIQIYKLFTGTATRYLHELDASYIDIKGDGVFGLFNHDQAHRALAAALSFKTFADTVFRSEVAKTVKNDVLTGARIGIHQSSLLASRMGLRRNSKREDRHNEVWVGDAVNFASKLSGLSESGEIHISPRFYKRLKDERALRSCSCGSGFFGFRESEVDLWESVNLIENEKVPLEFAYKTNTRFCKKCGDVTCRALLGADSGPE